MQLQFSHLDYCDAIFHIPVKTRETNDFDCSRTLNYQMFSLERTQYQAALAVSGTWKGTNRLKIYDELGWSPQVNLDEGLDRCARWCVENLDVLQLLPQVYSHKP